MALRVVEETKQLLLEAREWSIWSWASDANQNRVRSAIESATKALEREVGKTKKSWSLVVTNAYAGAEADLAIRRYIRKFRDAEREMNRATAQSQATFAEAEQELNAGKARRGATEALLAIEIHETVLDLARALGNETVFRDTPRLNAEKL
jgi:hypothetical protein